MGQLFDFTTHGTGQTTDAATAVTIASLSVSGIDGASFSIEGLLIGQSTANTSTSALGRRTLKRISGVLSALGTLLLLAPFDGDLVGVPVMVIDVSGDSIRLRALGLALTTIDWNGYLTVSSSSYSG
jgi:hypothetical protein